MAPPPAITSALINVDHVLTSVTQTRLTALGAVQAAVTEALPEHLTLSFEDGVLSLHDQQNAQARLAVNFSSGALYHRSQQHLNGEHVVKACQIKGQQQLRLLDATCGLATDSFLLSQAGFQVTACESHPVIHALLLDGLARYEMEGQKPPFELLHADATEHMNQLNADVIYLDPMFPAVRKSAKNKKAMQLFQQLHHAEQDNAATLLSAALQTSCHRVVIKRPLKSAILTAAKPTFQISGKTCRFDAYQLK